MSTKNMTIYDLIELWAGVPGNKLEVVGLGDGTILIRALEETTPVAMEIVRPNKGPRWPLQRIVKRALMLKGEW